MRNVSEETITYNYKDVIIDPYSEATEAAIGKLCYFSVSPKDVLDTANRNNGEVSTLVGVKDDYFLDEDETRWDCIIVSKDKPKPKYIPFETRSQFLDAYRCHRGEDPENTPGHQLASLGGVWVKSVKCDFYAMVTEVYDNGVVTRPDCGLVSWDELYTTYVFPDDTPCGECMLRE